MIRLYLPFLFFVFAGYLAKAQKTQLNISETYPTYWELNGAPTLLLGGSNEDNLFQVPYLQTHLDSLQDVGGNYVRCTMSSRDPGNLWPFAQQADGRYDLNQFNQAYWQRFEDFLKETDERGIVVQLEVWATFDFYRDNWLVNPFNPANNVNYSAARTNLKVIVDTHPIFTDNDFFRSVPLSDANLALLGYQQRYVDKLLSHSLPYGHVLYCMDNETSVTAAWGRFWSDYIKKVAAEQGKTVYTTEMWDPHDLNHAAHRETFDHPEIYDFADISQNNHKSGQEHWDNGLKQVSRIARSGVPRPLNNVKIYGNDGGRHQTTQNAVESFCRNVFFGAASARFHRPTSGQGLNGISQKVIGSLVKFADRFNFFQSEEATAELGERESNEAYCRKIGEKAYALYFSKSGSVTLDLSHWKGKASLRWLSISSANWQPAVIQNTGRALTLKTPVGSELGWLLLIERP